MTDPTPHVVAIVLPHVEHMHRAELHAESIARQLAAAGLLAGQKPTISAGVLVREGVANLLQCVLSWRPAEQIAAGLDEAGLLAERA